MGRFSNSRFSSGEEIIVKKATSVPTACPNIEAGSKRYDGSMDGCKGIVLGPSFVKQYPGDDRPVERVAFAPTDMSKDGRPTGVVEIPVERIRHTAIGRRVAVAAGIGASRIKSIFMGADSDAPKTIECSCRCRTAAHELCPVAASSN